MIQRERGTLFECIIGNPHWTPQIVVWIMTNEAPKGFYFADKSLKYEC